MITAIIISLVIGVLLTYLTLRPKLKEVVKRNEDAEVYNIQLEMTRNDLLSQIDATSNNLQAQLQNLLKVETDMARYKEQEQELKESIAYIKENGLEAQIKIAEDNFEKASEEARKYYLESKEAYEQEYLKSLEEATSNFDKTINQKKLELAKIQEAFNEAQDALNSIIESNKLALAKASEQDFHRLVLSPKEEEELKHLKTVMRYLSNPEPFNKVIYKYYYENLTNDLIGRIFGNNHPTGIYKITSLATGKCYVGQAVDVPARWKQHIKRGLGAEAATKNKLYPAMAEEGVENFTFEFLEECPRDKLNEREDFWQETFQAKTFGYSIK